VPTRVGIDGRRTIHDADVCRCCNRRWRADIRHASEVADKILSSCRRRGCRVELQPAGLSVIGCVHAGGGGDRRKVDGVSQAQFLHLEAGHVDSKGQYEDQCGHEHDGI